MRICVFGAGGVGTLLAGLLGRAGHDVVLVARGEARTKILAHGVRVESPLGEFTAKVDVPETLAKTAAVSVLLLAVKAWQVPSAVAELSSWLSPTSLVIPLQNGIDAPDQCADLLGDDRILGGSCRMLSFIVEPGHVKHLGDPPSVTLGAWRSPLGGREEDFRRALESAGVRVDVVSDFRRALWEKLAFIASFGGVGAVTRSTAGAIRAIPETRALLASAIEEVRVVGTGRGIQLAPDIVARTLAFVDALPEQATSSLQRDIVARRPSEIDALSGAIVRVGREVGVPVPIHTAIHAALQPQEEDARSRL